MGHKIEIDRVYPFRNQESTSIYHNYEHYDQKTCNDDHLEISHQQSGYNDFNNKYDDDDYYADLDCNKGGFELRKAQFKKKLTTQWTKSAKKTQNTGQGRINKTNQKDNDNPFEECQESFKMRQFLVPPTTNGAHDETRHTFTSM